MIANSNTRPDKPPPAATIAQLRNQLRAWEQSVPSAKEGVISTGCHALDALLPDGGLRRGSLVEWIGDGEASGAGTLSLLIARRICDRDRPTVLIDIRKQIYPVALAALGFNLSTLVLVRPDSERDALWASEQALRCEAVAVVWSRIDNLGGIAFRRLQLAVEASQGVGFLVRPTQALKQPSWASVRLLTKPRPSRRESPRFRVEAVGSHGRTVRSETDIEIDCLRGMIHDVSDSHETGVVSLASRLADPAARRRKAGA